MRYLSDDGTVTVRTVKDVRFPVSDIGVGIWSEPLPEGVGFAKVLPNDWQNCIGQSALFNIPGLRLTQFKDAAVVNFTKISAFQIRPDQTNPHRYSFYREAVLYDSGTGCFWLPEGEFVLLMCLLGSSSGPFIADHKPVINSAMTALGSPYQLTEYDLSAFPTYD